MTRKPRNLHYYTATLWCERTSQGKRRIMAKTFGRRGKWEVDELNLPAQKRLYKWLKQACDWVDAI